MKNDEPDALDRALDSALAAYSSHEPLAGFEQRIIARLHAAPPQRLFHFGRWALAAAGLAALATIVTLIPRDTPPSLSIQPPSPTAPPITQVKVALVKTIPAHLRKPMLSRDERALLAFVEQSPEQARAAFLDWPRQSDQPIQIDQITIQPLRSDYANNPKNDSKDDAK